MGRTGGTEQLPADGPRSGRAHDRTLATGDLLALSGQIVNFYDGDPNTASTWRGLNLVSASDSARTRNAGNVTAFAKCVAN